MDLRVVKTHKTIRTAFIELLQQMPFEKISVQQILELALVNRTTFYKYYSGKSDLAGKMIADFKADYQQFLNERLATDNLSEFLRTTTPKLYEQHRTLLALWKVHTKRHHLRLDMHQMIKQQFIRHANAHTENDAKVRDFDYQGEMAATLVLASMTYYFEQGLPLLGEGLFQELEEMMSLVRLEAKAV
ncbi:TetR/AcrR family transcriptional regulator [Testudinibacter sp. P27/CKL/0425]